MLIVAPIVGSCNCSMFCCALLYVHSCSANILMGKRGLAAFFCLSSWCLVIVEWLFLTMPQVVCSLWLWYFLIIITYFCCFNTIPNITYLRQLSFFQSNFRCPMLNRHSYGWVNKLLPIAIFEKIWSLFKKIWENVFVVSKFLNWDIS